MTDAHRDAAADRPARADAPGALRLFVALALEPHVQEAIAEGTAPLRRTLGDAVRWTAPPTLHLTLRFLGSQPGQLVGPLTAALTRAAASVRAFPMRLHRLGAFPTAARARVLWIGVDRTDPLAALHRLVEEACATVGLAPELRAFHPHVTLGRVRHGARVDRHLLLAPQFDHPLESGVRTLDLMESELAPTGARHHAVARLPLADAVPPTLAT